MAVYDRNSELVKFIAEYSEPYAALFTAIKKFASTHRSNLNFQGDAFNGGQVELKSIRFQFAGDVEVIEDKIAFDAIIDGCFTVGSVSEQQRFRLNCVMTIEDGLTSFAVKNTSVYSKEQKKKLQFAVDKNFVPIIRREDFDAEAERILQKLYPQALAAPIPVPIDRIAESIGLKIIDTEKLSRGLDVFGEICFSDGFVKVYDAKQDAYRDMAIKRGTMLIDPKTYYLHNFGCVYNTIAHELFHWERHRVYAAISSILAKRQTITQRCPTVPKDKKVHEGLMSGEDCMEWQANGVAPKILMPKEPTARKMKELAVKYGYKPGLSDGAEKLKAIICELSKFYMVSKQAAKIRMIELGYFEAAGVCNNERDCSFFSSEILGINAYEEYRDNEGFRLLIDSNLFRNVEGRFVINADKYRMPDERGEYRLTEYAKTNIEDCALIFGYNIIEFFKHIPEIGILYSGRRQMRPVSLFTPEYNQESIDKALRITAACQQQIASARTFGDITPAQMIISYMERANPKWNSTIFRQRTGLSKNDYSRITTKPNRKFELPIIVSICIGLKLPNEHARELITKAGYVLNKTNPEDIVYSMILSGAVSDDIFSCNAFIEEIEKKNPGSKIRKLGAQAYDGQVAGEG